MYRLRKPTPDGRTELILTPLELLTGWRTWCGSSSTCLWCVHGGHMRLIAFILDSPVVERILEHIGEPTEAPAVLPARSPPQGELSFDVGVEAVAGVEACPEIDQTGGGGDGWG